MFNNKQKEELKKVYELFNLYPNQFDKNYNSYNKSDENKTKYLLINQQKL